MIVKLRKMLRMRGKTLSNDLLRVMEAWLRCVCLQLCASEERAGALGGMCSGAFVYSCREPAGRKLCAGDQDRGAQETSVAIVEDFIRHSGVRSVADLQLLDERGRQWWTEGEGLDPKQVCVRCTHLALSLCSHFLAAWLSGSGSRAPRDGQGQGQDKNNIRQDKIIDHSPATFPLFFF